MKNLKNYTYTLTVGSSACELPLLGGYSPGALEELRLHPLEVENNAKTQYLKEYYKDSLPPVPKRINTLNALFNAKANMSVLPFVDVNGKHVIAYFGGVSYETLLVTNDLYLYYPDEGLLVAKGSLGSSRVGSVLEHFSVDGRDYIKVRGGFSYDSVPLNFIDMSVTDFTINLADGSFAETGAESGQEGSTSYGNTLKASNYFAGGYRRDRPGQWVYGLTRGTSFPSRDTFYRSHGPYPLESSCSFYYDSQNTLHAVVTTGAGYRDMVYRYYQFNQQASVIYDMAEGGGESINIVPVQPLAPAAVIQAFQYMGDAYLLTLDYVEGYLRVFMHNLTSKVYSNTPLLLPSKVPLALRYRVGATRPIVQEAGPSDRLMLYIENYKIEFSSMQIWNNHALTTKITRKLDET